MKRLIMLIEVNDVEQQQNLYETLQFLIDKRELEGFFTLVDDGVGMTDLPNYMSFELNNTIPGIVALENKYGQYYNNNSK